MRSAIAAVQDDKDFGIASPRITNAKSLAEELMKKVIESEENIDKFDVFTTKLMKVLRNACKDDKRLKLHSTKWKKMWSAFHKARVDVLPVLWAELMKNLGVKNDDTGKNTVATCQLCTLTACN